MGFQPENAQNPNPYSEHPFQDPFQEVFMEAEKAGIKVEDNRKPDPGRDWKIHINQARQQGKTAQAIRQDQAKMAAEMVNGFKSALVAVMEEYGIDEVKIDDRAIFLGPSKVVEVHRDEWNRQFVLKLVDLEPAKD